MKVYLAGPIAGLNYDEATGWRYAVREELEKYNIQGYSPMRDKSYLQNVKSFSKQALVDRDPYKFLSPLSSVQGIIGRDSYDVMSSDLILVNFIGAKDISIGTAWEIGLAFGCNKPVVVAIEDEGNPNDHGLCIGSCRFRTNSLESAIALTKAILLP